LTADGFLRDGAAPAPLRLTKKLVFAPGGFHLTTDYRLENLGNRDLKFLFLAEWNLTLLAGDAPDRRYYVKGRTLASPQLNSVGEEGGVQEAGMMDDWLKLQVAFKTKTPAKFWRYPVETISQSEGGFERVYQGSCLLLGFEVHLAPQKSFEASVETSLKETGTK